MKVNAVIALLLAEDEEKRAVRGLSLISKRSGDAKRHRASPLATKASRTGKASAQSAAQIRAKRQERILALRRWRGG